LNSNHEKSSEKTLANALSEDIADIEKMDENLQKILLAHINRKHDTFNNQIDRIAKKEIAETKEQLKDNKQKFPIK